MSTIMESNSVTSSAPTAKKVTARVNLEYAKGGALAATIVAWVTKQASAEEAKGEKLMRFVADIVNLKSNIAHIEFRRQLDNEVTLVRESMKHGGETEGPVTMGYSDKSFIVMCSNFRTLSYAAALGWKPSAGSKWVTAYREAVSYKQAQASNGVTAVPVGQKRGRKAKTEAPVAHAAIIPAQSLYIQCVNITGKLSDKELSDLLTHVTQMIQMRAIKKAAGPAPKLPGKAIA